MQISMPRGDIRNIRFSVKNGDEFYTDFDEIYFSVKKSVQNSKLLIQKKYTDGDIMLDETTGYFSFKIMPEDTDSLDYGKYAFDIEVVKGNMIKQTSVGTLELTSEVTFSSNE